MDIDGADSRGMKRKADDAHLIASAPKRIKVVDQT